jgi:hypothetical protein
MKAIFIKDTFCENDIEALNLKLKDCKYILHTQTMLYGTVLICDNITRKDKLEKINEKSNEEGTDNNSM